MIDKRITPIIGILLVLTLLSFLIPLNTPTGKVFGIGEPSLTYVDEFRITRYYTPNFKDFKEYTTTGKDMESTEACGVNNKGYYEDVKCQGSGVLEDGSVCYHYFLDTNEDSLSKCKKISEGESVIAKTEKGDVKLFSRGSTGDWTNPTPHKTIAVPSELRYRNTKKYVYLFFGDDYAEWNGCYKGEDAGSMIKDKKIDLYVGVGKDALEATSKLPDHAKVYEGCELDENYDMINADSDLVTSADRKNKIIGKIDVNPSFEIEENLDFTIFDKIQDKVEFLASKCKDVDDKRGCVETALTQDNYLGLKIGPQDEEEFELFNFTEQILLCDNTTDTNCYCNITLDLSYEKLYKEIEIKDNLLVSTDTGISYPLVNKDKIKKLFINSWSVIRAGSVYDNNLYINKENFKFVQKKPMTKKLELPYNRQCVYDQDTYMLSAKTTKKFVHYDAKEERYKLDAPDIEFAFMLTDIEPPKEIDFKLETVNFENNQLLVTFDNSIEKDIVGYYLFVSNDDFSGENTKDMINLESKIPIAYFKLFENIDFKVYDDYVSLQPKCDLIEQPVGSKKYYCEPKSELIRDGITTKEKLEPYALYYFEKNGAGSYAILIALDEEVKYENGYFSVAAMDESENIQESLNVKSVKPLQNKPFSVFDVQPVIDRKLNGDIEFDMTDSIPRYFDYSLVEDEPINYWLFSGETLYNYGYIYEEPILSFGSKIVLEEYDRIIKKRDLCYYIVPMKIPFNGNSAGDGEYINLFRNTPYYKELLDKDLFHVTCI